MHCNSRRQFTATRRCLTPPASAFAICRASRRGGARIYVRPIAGVMRRICTPEGPGMDEGDYVRHTNAPEWGIGRVVRKTADRIEVLFSRRRVVLDLKTATPLLRTASAAEFESHAVSTPSPKKPRPPRNAPCITCAEALARARRSADEQWKSCPNCSLEDGREHIFYRYPDDFGDTQMTAGEADAGAGDGWCAACRLGGSQRKPRSRRCHSLS